MCFFFPESGTAPNIQQDNLASLYQQGRGVARDLKLAYMWRLLSLQGDDATQSSELRDLGREMSKNEIAEAVSAASKWKNVEAGATQFPAAEIIRVRAVLLTASF